MSRRRGRRCECAYLGELCRACEAVGEDRAEGNDYDTDTREMDYHYPRDLAPRSPW